MKTGILVAIGGALAIVAGCAQPDENGSGAQDAPTEAVIEKNILGTAYLGRQSWEDAAAAFDAALVMDPDSPLLLTNRAVALIQKGEIDAAVASLERALAIDPDYPFAHYNLGLIDNQNGRFDTAAAHFEAVAAYDPGELFTQYYLGTTLARIDRQDDAMAAYRRALELDPTHVSTLYSFGRLLIQSGDAEEGTALIRKSQEVRARSGLDEAVGGQYGEQGPFAMGIDFPGDALAAPAAIGVTWADRELSGALEDGPVIATPREVGGTAVVVVGSGRSVTALGRDGSTAVGTAPGSVASLAAGDVDGDGTVEILAADDAGVTIFDAAGGSSRITELASGGASADLALVDRDHDGDLDVFWCATGLGCRLATNDGKGSFSVAGSAEHGFALDLTGPVVEVTFSDLDNDRDIDLVVAWADGVEILTNQRDGSFDPIGAESGLGPGIAPTALAIADLDKDGFMDLVSAEDGRIRWRKNRRGAFARPVEIAETGAGSAPLLVLDFDNDGFLDLVHGTHVFRGEGQSRFAAAADGLAHPAVAVVDGDGDGDLDLVARAGSAWHLAANEGGNRNHWIRLDSRGVGDNRAGVGAKVEILAGALRQKFEVRDANPIHVGLGDREQVQSARYLWPSGVLQDEVELAANRAAEIEQLDRKGTSCPLLYAWRDGRWRFVTDFLGGAAVGYQLAPGVFNTPDSDEYVKIDGGLTRDDDGRVRLRLNNQLEEVIWFDRAELLAIDHPEGTEVFPDERLMPGPPWPGFELFASADVRPVVGARGVESGLDHTRRLAARDRDYVRDFGLLPPKGYAEPHTLELDLGELPAKRRVVLLLDGWIDYADSSANVAAAQAGLRLSPPRISVAGPDGRFSPGRSMGFPAGLPKTMTVDITEEVAGGRTRCRIATDMRIYWDRARVLVGGEDVPLRVHRAAPATAELSEGGFPEPTSPDGALPHEYDPARVRRLSPWKAHAGHYTALGDVRGRLLVSDDRFVTTKNGDQIELSFEVEDSPGPGWTRTWLLYADGFGKDMDPNSAASEHLAPIPYHGMASYPYAEARPVAEPMDREASRYVPSSPHGFTGAVPQALTAGR